MPTDQYSIYDTDGGRVIAFQGQLHAAACGAMNDQVMQAVEDTEGTLTFDLMAVTFVASSFLRIVLAANRLKSRSGFEIINVQPDVKKVFKLAGLWDALKVSEVK
ncbi:MAG: STAS domain-containing protein [Puniceicoccales bacterium]